MNNRIIASIAGMGIFMGGFSQIAPFSITLICAIGLGIMLGGLFSAIKTRGGISDS